MKIHKTIALSIAMVVLSAIASMAQQVRTDYDHAANFVQYQTYSWESVQTKDPLWVDRIKSAVNSSLSAKGWTEVKSGGDVSIMAMEMTRNQQTLNTFYDGFRRLALGRLGRGHHDNADLQSRHPRGRPVRHYDKEADLARFVQ